ncbi:hypothetical protein SteCoe_3889 [Stentor coeruleus]|uniref:LRRK2 beta-propeller domain-containing protein n=1 Tax=Stentor coeruleus TaxID=5963 RepID=A0A1R2CW10_9CILI|nr:hypothetical protein SteCoe_3889 [Stentor coeruleus]
MDDCLFCKTLNICNDFEDYSEKLFYFKAYQNSEGYFLHPSDKFKANERIKKRFTMLNKSKKYLEKYIQKYPKCFLFLEIYLKTIEIAYNQLFALDIKKIYTNTEIILLSHICHSELFYQRLNKDFFIYPNDIVSKPFIYERLSYQNPSKNILAICKHKNIEVSSHETIVSGLALSKDKNYLFTTGECCMVMWDLIKKHQIHIFEYTCSPKPIIISHKKNLVISGSKDDRIKIWDINTKSLISELKNSNPSSLLLIQNDNILIEGSIYGKIKFWCLKTFSYLKEIHITNGPINCLAISSNNEKLYIGTKDGKIRIFNLKTNQKIDIVEDLKYRVLCIVITKNNKNILSGSADGILNIFDLETNKRCGLLKGHIGCIFDIKIINDDKQVVSCGMDCTVRIWDIVNMCQIAELCSHKERVNQLAVSDDGKMCFSGGSDSKICAWNLDDMRLEYEKLCFGIATRGWLSKDNKYLFCYHSFSGLSVWDLKKEDYVMLYKGNFKPISVEETQDKRFVVVACQSGFYFLYKFRSKRTRKYVWNVEMGESK